MAFEWEKTIDDFDQFVRWMQRQEDDGNRSWRVSSSRSQFFACLKPLAAQAWWREEISYLNGLDLWRKVPHRRCLCASLRSLSVNSSRCA